MEKPKLTLFHKSRRSQKLEVPPEKTFKNPLTNSVLCPISTQKYKSPISMPQLLTKFRRIHRPKPYNPKKAKNECGTVTIVVEEVGNLIGWYNQV